jgi:hypothetical protein
MILGLRVRALYVDKTVATGNTGQTGDCLIAALKEDHSQGLHPFVLSECGSLCVMHWQRLDWLLQLLRLERHRLTPSIG